MLEVGALIEDKPHRSKFVPYLRGRGWQDDTGMPKLLRNGQQTGTYDIGT